MRLAFVRWLIYKHKLGFHDNEIDRSRKDGVGVSRDEGGEDGSRDSVKYGSHANVQDGSRANVKDGSRANVKDGSRANVKDGSRANVKDGSRDNVNAGVTSRVPWEVWGGGSSTPTFLFIHVCLWRINCVITPLLWHL